jgi:hypothetical protein
MKFETGTDSEHIDPDERIVYGSMRVMVDYVEYDLAKREIKRTSFDLYGIPWWYHFFPFSFRSPLAGVGYIAYILNDKSVSLETKEKYKTLLLIYKCWITKNIEEQNEYLKLLNIRPIDYNSKCKWCSFESQVELYKKLLTIADIME